METKNKQGNKKQFPKLLKEKEINDLNDLSSRTISSNINPLLEVIKNPYGDLVLLGDLFKQIENLYPEGFYTWNANDYLLSEYKLKSTFGHFYQNMKKKNILIGEQSESSHWKFKINKNSPEYQEYLKQRTDVDIKLHFNREEKLSKIEDICSELDYPEITKYIGRQNLSNLLYENNLKSYEDIKNIGKEGLMKIRGIGVNTRRRFLDYLNKKGFSL